MEEKKKEQGEKFVYRTNTPLASAAWKEKEPKWKWQNFGQIPAKP